ncbi:hypothetical protein B0W47_00605 [Komagataeibacter nataicola]|uniref:Uncharacterized protein n=1 Tax=Komagataeibacter nataicola TaxID=265960 RepID=A0A9N7GZ32_9PROT|nr:hypothetical protein [Komagataeibacter nataicola]AQU86202.1 hypothetical protein B0W47_00605 [Komagataeibacter nataicola]PYD65336.1 hypothetical protein CDI09_14110 [Komagataeibacter nataicola]WNM08394.1 hypothetical protein RI056_16275 [Komagataeibacter nataicola]GBR23054.1 hypothetical protein AA0616_2431 [Komagataeibacter nataicola NRIC 0616]
MTKKYEYDENFVFYTKARNLAILSEMSKALDRECRGSSIMTINTLSYRGFNVALHKAGGIVMMAQCRYGSVIIHDPDGKISRPSRLTFPKGFLKKCRRPRLLERMDENCQPYECEASVPDFMVPDMVSAIYCGAFINGNGNLPEDDKNTGIWSCRAEWGEGDDDWSLFIGPLSIDPARVAAIIQKAPEEDTTTILSDPAIRTVSRVITAHARESDPTAVGVWYSRTFGSGAGSVVVHRNILDPNIIITTSVAVALAGQVVDDARMPGWLADMSEEVVA